MNVDVRVEFLSLEVSENLLLGEGRVSGIAVVLNVEPIVVASIKGTPNLFSCVPVGHKESVSQPTEELGLLGLRTSRNRVNENGSNHHEENNDESHVGYSLVENYKMSILGKKLENLVDGSPKNRSIVGTNLNSLLKNVPHLVCDRLLHTTTNTLFVAHKGIILISTTMDATGESARNVRELMFTNVFGFHKNQFVHFPMVLR